jgi:hypothetical protein
MKSLLFWLFSMTLFITPFQLDAQRNCASSDYLELQKQNDPKRIQSLDRIEEFTRQIEQTSFRAVDGIITIPVVVHVVYNTTAENVSTAQVQSQIDILNEDFRRLNADADNAWSQADDTEIEFCLASVGPTGDATTGITRTQTSTTAFSYSSDAVKYTSSGGINAWPRAQYMNMWVCDISGGILGYAQFPGGAAATDGIVIDYAYFGNIGTVTSPFDLGRTATHEVGHWLNLRHIWGDGGCSQDDLVSDTPISDGANYGCPLTHVSCSTLDMVQNYMDYTDDSCMNLFSTGQKSRMRALFEPGGARVSLLASAACGTPAEPTCEDGIQNGGETGVDCGGPCANVCPSCTDGVQNGTETGVDCGGPSCPTCPCTGEEVTLTLNFDNYPEETRWNITDANGGTVANGGPYGSQADGSTLTIAICLNDGCYTLNVLDSYGDGMCCVYGTGSYSLNSSTGAVLASGADFVDNESTAFCVNAPVTGCDPANFVNPPTGMNAGFSASQLTLSWNSYANSARCTIQGNRTALTNNGTFNVGSFNGTVAPTQKNFPLSQLVAGDEYRWRIRCSCREAGVAVNSTYSAWQYFTAPGNVINDGSSFLESSSKSFISMENLYIYPNPAQGELNIRWSESSAVKLNVQVLDMTGKVVMESEMDTQKSNTYRMDIQSLESGMYFIRLSDGTAQVLQRWVKQ